MINGSIATIAKIIKNVCSSAAEAEIAALFMNAKHALPLRTTLEELGHPQPATPIFTDNSTAHGVINGTVKQNRSKAIDMRFYWLRDRVKQGQFTVHWAPGATNLADYYTKHHSPAHHKNTRPIYMSEQDSPHDMQGCVKRLQNTVRPARAQPKTTTSVANQITAKSRYDPKSSCDPEQQQQSIEPHANHTNRI
jgi:hypothetical protein